jgi:hypothetical protein
VIGAAVQADGGLLIRAQRQCIREVVHCPHDQPAVIPPREIAAPAVFLWLVMKIDVLLIDLVVILAVCADRQVGVEDNAAVFRSKEPGRLRAP